MLGRSLFRKERAKVMTNMDNPCTESVSGETLSRRAFLGGIGKTTAAITAILAVGGGIGWVSSGRISGAIDPRFKILRHRDVKLFSALLPAIIPQASAAAQTERFLASFDSMLQPASKDTIGKIRNMSNALTGIAVRPILLGTVTDWSELSTERKAVILSNWRSSDQAILNTIYATATGLTHFAWYMDPENQKFTGYPGPPIKVVDAI